MHASVALAPGGQHIPPQPLGLGAGVWTPTRQWSRVSKPPSRGGGITIGGLVTGRAAVVGPR